MKIVLLDTNGLGEDIDLSPLAQVGTLVQYYATDYDVLPQRIADADVIVTNKLKLNRDNLAGAASLKLICVTATGFDGIDLPYCRERGIGVCNVPGYSTDSVAQLTLAMVLSLSTHLESYRHHVHSGAYAQSGCPNLLTPVWHELSGKTWGIIGCGNIGRKVAAVARAMGCRVLAFRRSVDPDFESADLNTILETADIITVHLPLNEETRGILSREKIHTIKPGAILVNVARGAIADEAALVEAVEEGIIGGLGVDVFTAEPFPENHPYSKLYGNPNVILTPHCAWGSQEARNRCIREVADNIAAFWNGEKRNRVD